MMQSAIAVGMSGMAMHVFVIGTDNQMYGNLRSSMPNLFSPFFSTGWYGWGPVPGGRKLNSAPTVATWIYQTGDRTYRIGLDVFALGTENEMLRSSYSNGVWDLDWSSLGGTFERTPAAASFMSGLFPDQPTRIDVVGLGSDNCVYHTIANNGIWQPGWTAVDLVCSSSPTVISKDDSHVDVFVVGADNHMYQMSSAAPNSSLTSPARLGVGVFTSAPSVAFANGRLCVFALGTDNQVYCWGGSSWVGLGDTFNSPPVAVSNQEWVEVFAVGDDNQMYRNSVNARTGETTGWQPMGGRFNSMPAAISWNRRIDIFGLGLDNHVYWQGWDPVEPGPARATPGPSAAWQDLGGLANPSP
jgi:hypothetical protein